MDQIDGNFFRDFWQKNPGVLENTSDVVFNEISDEISSISYGKLTAIFSGIFGKKSLKKLHF